MAIDNKKLNFEIIIDDDDLKNAGFEKASIINKDMIINFVNGNIDKRQPIICKYKVDDLTGTLKNLRKELVNKGIDIRSVQQLEIFLSEKLIEKQKELATQNEDPTNATEVQKIRKEIDNFRKSIGHISMDEWQVGVLERHQRLKTAAKANLPNLWPGLEFVLSAKSILNIKGCTLPFAGILLGPPSCLKTVNIELFRKWPQTYYTDNFSARSFVSHSTAVSREQLQEIDMLPRIRNKLFLTPELAPTFAAKDEELIQVLGIMTRILDGHGYESDTGAHGHRGYNERMMFVWLGAAVDIPRKVHKHLATLGPKLYFLRLSAFNKSEDDYFKQLGDDFEAKIKEIHTALFEYLKYFESCPRAVIENEVPKILWDDTKDEESAVRQIIKLGQLLAHLRGVVSTWETQGTQGSDYSYCMPTIEEPGRAITQLRNLARGHALIKGRNSITSDDIPIVIKVVLSTASIERATIFDILISHKGTLTTSVITRSLNVTAHTAHRTMTELSALGLVDSTALTNTPNSEKKITLKADFSWFLSEEFQKLKESFDSEEEEQQRQEAEMELEEKDTLSSQKNESATTEEVYDDANGREESEEKFPSNLASVDNDQKSKEDQHISESRREEKIPISMDNTSSPSIADPGADLVPSQAIKFTAEYNEKEPIFWRVIGEISYDDGLVEYDKLQERLVATGQFYVGEAILMIEHMEKLGRIEKAERYNVYRMKESAPTNIERHGDNPSCVQIK